MPAIISPMARVMVDQGGNPMTELWTLLEYRESYAAGGIAFDLSPYFKRVDKMVITPISGSQFFTANSGLANSGFPTIYPSAQDYGTPASIRFQVFALDSSGRGMLEATAVALSGMRFQTHILGY